MSLSLRFRTEAYKRVCPAVVAASPFGEPSESSRPTENDLEMTQEDGRDPVWRLLNALAVLVGLLVVGMVVVVIVTSV